jgi:hypothetical protein
VKTLLGLGANQKAITKFGHTPKDLAARLHRDESRVILEKASDRPFLQRFGHGLMQ